MNQLTNTVYCSVCYNRDDRGNYSSGVTVSNRIGHNVTVHSTFRITEYSEVTVEGESLSEEVISNSIVEAFRNPPVGGFLINHPYTIDVLGGRGSVELLFDELPSINQTNICNHLLEIFRISNRHRS